MSASLTVTLGRRVLVTGQASRAAPGKVNEDGCGVAAPDDPRLAERGFAVAVADGAGTDGGGAAASQAAMHAVLCDLYATPLAWSVPHALDRMLVSINDWLHAQNARRSDEDGAVTTLTLLLFFEDRYRVAHVGDTRAYRLRGDEWRLLTTDHTWPRHDMRHVLKRALGLDTHVVVDYAEDTLEEGDRFLLVSDGVWEVLGDRALRDAVAAMHDPQLAAQRLVMQSIERQGLYMGRNDASASLVEVVE